MQNMLSNQPAMYSSMYHYDCTIIPFVFIAGIFGLGYLMSKLSGKKLKSRVLMIILVIVLLKSSAAFYYGSGLGPSKYTPGIYAVTEHNQLANEVIKEIPEDASVLTTTFIMPHIANRKDIFVFPQKVEADVVLFDLSITPYKLTPKTYKEELYKYNKSSDYELVLEKGDFIMFKKRLLS